MLRQGLAHRKGEQNRPREKAAGAAGQGLSGRLGLWRVAIPLLTLAEGGPMGGLSEGHDAGRRVDSQEEGRKES